MRHEAILFDFDGTLVDTEWAIYMAWVRTFQRYGHELSKETYVQCIGSDFQTWSPKTHLEELTGQQFNWELMDKERSEEFCAELTEQGAVAGTHELLQELSEQPHIRLAVVSSSSHDWVDGWLDRLGLRPFFEQTICRGDAPRIKPAPDLYLQGAKALNLEPSACLVIEDSVNGIRAAKAAGMAAYAIPNRITMVSDFYQADAVINSIIDLRNILSSSKIL